MSDHLCGLEMYIKRQGTIEMMNIAGQGILYSQHFAGGCMNDGKVLSPDAGRGADAGLRG